LSKNLNQLKRSVQALHWKVEPWAEEDESPTPEAIERAALVSRLAWTMRPRIEQQEVGFEGLIYDLLDGWAKGVSVVELGWELRQDRKFGQVFAPRAAWWIGPHNYGWSTEGWLGLRAPDQNSRRGLVQEFPPDKCLISIGRAKTGHPLTGALLRPLAWWWCASNFSADSMLNLMQVFGLPLRWAQYDANAPQAVIDAVCAMLENMGSAAWAAFPAGTQLELKEPTKGSESYPQVSILDRADRQVDLLILGSSGTMDVAEKGTQALGTVHQEVQADVVMSAADFVASVLNLQLVPSILRLNYGDDEEAPEFCPEPKRIEDQKANAERDAILLSQGVAMPKSWFYERHQVPIPAEGEEVLEGRVPPALGFGFGGGQGNGTERTNATNGTDKPDATDVTEDATEDEVEALRARDAATEQLVNNVLEDLTGVQARWLGGVKPFFRELARKAQDSQVSDAEFIRALEQARRQFPEMFGKLDHQALAKALEGALGAAVANGALRGALKRPVKRMQKGGAR